MKLLPYFELYDYGYSNENDNYPYDLIKIMISYMVIVFFGDCRSYNSVCPFVIMYGLSVKSVLT